MNESKKFQDNFFELIQRHKDIVEKVAQHHLDFDTLYSRAEGILTGKALNHAEKHLSSCTQCQNLLVDLTMLVQTAADASQIEDLSLNVPKKILDSLPKSGKFRGAFAELKFTAEGMIKKVNGIVQSMGGLVENLSEFAVERLSPNTDYLAEVRTGQETGSDYRTQYRQFEIIFSTLPQTSSLEVYVTITGQRADNLADMKFRLIDKASNTYEPDSQITFKESLKLIFGNLNLINTSYEFQIASEPVAE